MNDFYPLPVTLILGSSSTRSKPASSTSAKLSGPAASSSKAKRSRPSTSSSCSDPTRVRLLLWSYDKKAAVDPSTSTTLIKQSDGKVEPLLVQGPRRVAALALLPSNAARQMVRFEVELSRRWLRPRHLFEAFKAPQANLEETKAKHEVCLKRCDKSNRSSTLQEVHHQF